MVYRHWVWFHFLLPYQNAAEQLTLLWWLTFMSTVLKIAIWTTESTLGPHMLNAMTKGTALFCIGDFFCQCFIHFSTFINWQVCGDVELMKGKITKCPPVCYPAVRAGFTLHCAWLACIWNLLFIKVKYHFVLQYLHDNVVNVYWKRGAS